MARASERGEVLLARDIPCWRARSRVRPGKTRYQKRLAASLVRLVRTRLGDEEARQATAAVSQASLSDLKVWADRALYQPSWRAIECRFPIFGLERVSVDKLVRCAIANPLCSWCLRLSYFGSKGDELRDTELLLKEAYWLHECFSVVGGLVQDLQRHRLALLSCDSESLARGLLAATRARHIWFQLYSPTGVGA